MTTQREWPRLVPDPDAPPDTDDETEPLELTETEPVEPDSDLLPVPDPVEGKVLAPYDRQPKKILPTWMDSPQIFIRYIQHQSIYTSSAAGFHLFRLPKYYARLVKYSPIGFGRIIRVWFNWIRDDLAHNLLAQLSASEALHFARTYEIWHRVRVFRAIVSGLALAGLVWAASWAHDNIRTGALILLAFLVAGGLGLLGRSADRRIVTEVMQFETPKLTYDLLVNALNVLGITQLTKSIKEFGTQAVALRSPIGYHGHGWRCEFDLPAGVPAAEVVAMRDRLASGLLRPVSAVWPSTRPDVSANRLSLYVADKPLSQMRAKPWPLLASGQTSVFQPIPLGQDATGLPISLTLIFTNGICGGQPRMGKTFSMRLIALGAALDPTCELHIYNLRGGSDWSAFKKVAHRYCAGEKDKDFEYVLAGLRDLKADMERRYDVIEGIEEKNPALVPEGKTTPELSARPELGLHPVFLFVDEFRVLFTDKRYKEEATKLLADLASRGPAAGIMAYAATQTVKKETVPKLISDMAIKRFCFKVASYSESNLILGNLSGAGYNAATFNETEKGIGYLVGEGDAPTVVRFSEVNGPQALAVTTRARAVRKARGLLSGYAVDDDLQAEDTQTPPLQHIADIWPGDTYSVTFDELGQRLEQRHPVAYANWSGDQVRGIVKPAGLTVVQVRRDNRYTGYGIRRDDLLTHLSDTTLAIEPADEDDE